MLGRRYIRAQHYVHPVHKNTYPRQEAPEAGQVEHPQLD